jgi:predicted regulator of Ras-like GTPase activity (Roadblock/LC7/MglB family)
MQSILEQISALDGVIGTSLFNEQGKILAHACPPLLDTNQLCKAASTVIDCFHGLQIAQTAIALDLRFAEGRMLVRTMPGAFLCILCAKNANFSMVTITLNLALKKLEQMIPKASDSVTTGKHALPADSGAGLKLRIAHLHKGDASASFDQLGMIAVSQATAKQLSDFFGKTAKKVKLVTESGGGGTFPFMIINDVELQYEGAIIVGPGIEKKLKANEGDPVTVHLG